MAEPEKEPAADLPPGPVPAPAPAPPRETGGPKGPDPTRYGDWEIGGKCVDF